MPGSSSPIDITTKRFSSTSPGNQPSNLTSALQNAAANGANAADIPPKANLDGRPAAGRQDSSTYAFGSSHSAARPITMAGQRKISEAGPSSYMGGMSWGGISIGSFLQDDIMMGGTSPYNVQSPSFHSSSYLPKMEANFWNNMKCCDQTFADLHELLAHFEDVHSQAPSTFPYRMSVSNSIGMPRRRSSLKPEFGNVPAVGQSANNQVRGFNTGLPAKMNGMQSYSTNRSLQNGDQRPATLGLQDMDTIGQMEMDDEPLQTYAQQQAGLFGQPAQDFSRNTTPRLSNVNPNLANAMGNDFQYSDPTTPTTVQQRFNAQHNPMVSSVNTPSLDTFSSARLNSPNAASIANNLAFENAFQQNNRPFDPQMLETLNSGLGNFNFDTSGAMVDYCIDEPAKALYSDNGGINSSQFPHFNFAKAGTPGNDESARRLQARQMAAGLKAQGKFPSEEERPFKCPVIGCEKAYKNANGLRYHEKHGHSTQKLKENGDGTMSIVDPVTSIPYPGTVGMEKEKPYRCEVCGKRYKNLNGLKYHRNHSPPCNPDFDFGNNGNTSSNNSAANLALSVMQQPAGVVAESGMY